MPKSKHRRKGRNKPPAGNDKGPVFTYRGRRYRGVRRLPAEYHPDSLNEHYGDDDAFMWCCELVRGALGDNADRVLSDVTLTTPDRLAPLIRQIVDAYGIQLALDKLHSDTRDGTDTP